MFETQRDEIEEALVLHMIQRVAIDAPAPLPSARVAEPGRSSYPPVLHRGVVEALQRIEPVGAENEKIWFCQEHRFVSCIVRHKQHVQELHAGREWIGELMAVFDCLFYPLNVRKDMFRTRHNLVTRRVVDVRSCALCLYEEEGAIDDAIIGLRARRIERGPL